jgi:hypothetical protein
VCGVGGVGGVILSRLTVASIVLLLAILTSYSVIAYIPGVATLGEPYIVLPSYLLPAVVKPGDVLEVSVRGVSSVDVRDAYLYGVNGRYKLAFEGFKGDTIRVDPAYSFEVVKLSFRTPLDVRNGLYTIVIESDKGLLWMPNSVIVDSGGGPRSFIRVAQLTDIHFGAEQGGYPNNFKHTRYVALLNTLVERFGVNLVVYTGDLIDVGTDIRSYRDFFRIVSQVQAPQLAITGNHDWAQVDSTRLLVERFYGRYVVPLRVWSFSYGDFLFVGIDTRMDGYPEMWQLDYLEDVIARNTDKTVVILMHHPLFTNAGEYRGKPEDLRRSIYSSWRDAGWEQAVRLLGIVERYKNVVAILAGHVHRDADAIYVRSDGSKVYFITTTTANHGYPEGYYWGMKVVEISRGEVKVLTPMAREYTPTSGSMNTERFLVFEVADPSNTAVSWFFNTTDFKEFNVGNVTLVFYLNKTSPLESYKIYGEQGRIHGVKSYDIGLYYLFKVYANITGYGRITVASYDDVEPPRLRIMSMSPREPALNRTLVINVEATDTGWGLERVVAIVMVNGAPRGFVEAQRTMDPTQFRIIVRIAEPGSYDVLVRAIDLRGNIREERLTFQVAPPLTETPGVGTPTPTQTQPTVETKTEAAEKPTTPPETPLTTPMVETKAPEEAGWASAWMLVAVLALVLVVVVVLLLIRRRPAP